MLENAEGLARRMIAASNDPGARIDLGYRLAWGRPPDRHELDRALRFIREASAMDTGGEASEIGPWTGLARILLTANEFLYLD